MANGNTLVPLDPESLIKITPIVRDADGNVVTHGQPFEISLGEFATFILAQAEEE